MGCTGERSARPSPRRSHHHVNPSSRGSSRRSEPHAATIRAWLVADADAPRKQRHTARRIWERLVDEHGADVAESTVRRYVRECRRELNLEHRDVAIVAHHLAGSEAQVDFGLADVIMAGERTSVSVFELRLSHSGVAIHVAFGSRARRRSSRAMSPRSHVSAACRPGSDTTTPVRSSPVS